MPAAVALPAIIGGGASIFSGILGAHSANTAADQQSNAQQQVINLLTGLPGQINPGLQQASDAAGLGATTAAGQAAAGVSQAAGQAGLGVQQAAAAGGQQLSNAAAGAGSLASDAAGAAQAGMSGAVGQANLYLNPYAGAGQDAIQNLMDMRPQVGGPFGLDQLQIDPGYAFRLAEGQKALQNSAAARGIVGTGGYLKSLADYSQGAASQEFQNAYSRFRQGQQDRIGLLSGVAGMGLQAGGQAAQNLIGGAQYGGNVGINAAQFGANAGMNAAQGGAQLGFDASQYAGNAGMNAAQFGGNAAMNAAQYSGNLGYMSANDQARNQMAAALGITGALTNQGNAQAAGTMGAGNAWQGMIGGLANAGGQFAAAYPWGGQQQMPLGRLPGLGWGGFPIPGMGTQP